MSETRYYRKGLGNRERVLPLLHADYHSGLVEYWKANDYRYRTPTTEIRLAREFGFCYGVDRAVEYAYATRDRFPDKRIWITGEIIHNPWVNRRLEEMGVRFLPPPGSEGDRLAEIAPDDVVLIPAFGVEQSDFLRLRDREVILVDTTCGSVLNVWKSVERYARDRFTAIVHGKVSHEETRATCSQVQKYPGSHWLVLRDKEQAQWVCDFVTGRLDATQLLERLGGSHSEGFDPTLHLAKIGVANQTTMLSTESLEIAEMLGEAMRARHRQTEISSQFRSFDTICSATQERQDAVLDLISEGIDLMIVIGGFNSSNTTHLVEISAQATSAFHVEDANCLVSPQWIRHQPLGRRAPVMHEGWLPERPLRIGVTAGASTPNSETGRTIAKLLGFRGVSTVVIDQLAAEGMRLRAEADRQAAESLNEGR
ncbi:MAG: 4-hydroxy-3-methylbut-2-enyl diphosphate reductase [Candidatus Eisenbacteria bacterium]|nr:4-hydroxy-3-methylbut-2-enyl diphosphate reductase [Candidatus Eisenbacteria bacterium]MCC7142751.1 4-hydroxy-3-methylbut-2-enyl diphosphate reductase [Candidatus Eisenbacteria bacterium]